MDEKAPNCTFVEFLPPPKWTLEGMIMKLPAHATSITNTYTWCFQPIKQNRVSWFAKDGSPTYTNIWVRQKYSPWKKELSEKWHPELTYAPKPKPKKKEDKPEAARGSKDPEPKSDDEPTDDESEETEVEICEELPPTDEKIVDVNPPCGFFNIPLPLTSLHKNFSASATSAEL